MNVVKALNSLGYVPILNISKSEWVKPVADILCRHGFFGIELLMRNPNALENLTAMKQYRPEMAVGAGTILTLEHAKAAKAAGADFLVCPGYDQKIVDWCNEVGLLVIPGCATASEIQAAYASGLRLVKFFPSEHLGGTDVIRQYASVFPGMKYIATNGINIENLGSYLREDFICGAGGTFCAPNAALESCDWTRIDSICTKISAAVHDFSLAHVGINADCEEDALKTAQTLCGLFGLPVINKGRSVFAGTAVEIMKNGGRGEKGHIGLRTNNVDRAVAFLASKGIGIIPETAGYDENGNMKYVYLDVEIAGFALHLVK